MSFVCPHCQLSGSLEIAHSIALPPDSMSDDIILQIVACSRCQFRNVAVYEESRRGALDSEAWDHRGYLAQAGDVESLESKIKHCPAPSDDDCPCAIHVELAVRSPGGRWLLSNLINWQGTFRMELAAQPGAASREDSPTADGK